MPDTITLPNGTIVPIYLSKTSTSTFRLRVKPNGQVRLTMPKRSSKRAALAFASTNSQWIAAQLSQIDLSGGYIPLQNMCQGYTFKFLGQDTVVKLIASHNYKFSHEGNVLKMQYKAPFDQDGANRAFDKWWKEESLRILNKIVGEMMILFEPQGCSLPQIKLRKMKAQWGNCRYQTNVITFNQWLTMAPMASVEYVVLHEMAHLIYPNHSKNFYTFIATHMPDYKAREKVLRHDVIHGL